MNRFNINENIKELAHKAEEKSTEAFSYIEDIVEHNQNTVLKAFIDNRVSESHFSTSTVYGYGDRGRETLDRLFADIMGCEDALIKYSFFSGTHTLSVMLFGVLRPGDTVLVVTGTPYDTIHSVFGINGKSGYGSLMEYGINYKQIDLTSSGEADLTKIEKTL